MSKKRRPLIPAELDVPRRLMFLALANADMRQALEAIDLAMNQPQSDESEMSRYMTFCDAAIVRYARPFCASRVVAPDSNKQASVALDGSYIPRTPGAKELHEEILAIRSSIVAHSDMRNRNVVLTRDPENSNGWYATVMGTHVESRSLRDFRRLAHAISVRVQGEIEMEAASQFSSIQIGEDVQIGGGNPAYIDALQQSWSARQKK